LAKSLVKRWHTFLKTKDFVENPVSFWGKKKPHQRNRKLFLWEGVATFPPAGYGLNNNAGGSYEVCLGMLDTMTHHHQENTARYLLIANHLDQSLWLAKSKSQIIFITRFSIRCTAIKILHPYVCIAFIFLLANFPLLLQKVEWNHFSFPKLYYFKRTITNYIRCFNFFANIWQTSTQVLVLAQLFCKFVLLISRVWKFTFQNTLYVLKLIFYL